MNPLYSRFSRRLTAHNLVLASRNVSKESAIKFAEKSIDVATGGRAYTWLQKYEEFVGLTEVRVAQDKVIQNERRKAHQELQVVENKLLQLKGQIDKFQRGSSSYLRLSRVENSLVRRKTKLTKNLQLLEDGERTTFTSLSGAVRESHEKERARAERTKYWSIMGSAAGALIGIMGTTINNHRRRKELRTVMKENSESHQQALSLAKSLDQALVSLQPETSPQDTDAHTELVSTVQTVAERTSQLSEELQRVHTETDTLLRQVADLRTAVLLTSLAALCLPLISFVVSRWS